MGKYLSDLSNNHFREMKQKEMVNQEDMRMRTCNFGDKNRDSVASDDAVDRDPRI